jgi:long-chain acyl-CoA synthetase
MHAPAVTCQRIDALTVAWAKEAGERTAVQSGPSSIRWRELDAQVEALAQSMARRGLRPGDRIAFLGAPSADFLIAWLAIMRAGGVYVGLNPRYTASEVLHAVELTQRGETFEMTSATTGSATQKAAKDQ